MIQTTCHYGEEKTIEAVKKKNQWLAGVHGEGRKDD